MAHEIDVRRDEAVHLAHQDISVVHDPVTPEPGAPTPAVPTPAVPTPAVPSARDPRSGRVQEAQLFRIAMQHAPIGMAVASPDGRFLKVNAALCAFLGRTSEDLLTRTWQELTHPDDLGDNREQVAALITGGQDSFRMRKRYLHADGSVLHADVCVAIVRSPDGTPRYQLAQVLDFTEQIRAEAQRESEAARRAVESLHRIVVRVMGDGVVVQAADGRIVEANPAAERILGLTGDQLRGRRSVDPRWRSIHEDGSPFPGDQHPAMRALATGEPVRDVVMGVHKPSGELTWLLVNAEPVLGGAPQQAAVVATFTDITHMRVAEQEVRAANAQLDGLLNAIDDPVVVLHPSTDLAGSVVDLQVVQLNRAAERLRVPPPGSRPGALVAWAAGTGLAPETLLRAARSVVTTGIPTSVPLDVRQSVARTRTFDARIAPFDTAHERALVLVARDVSGAAATRRSLELSQHRYRASVDALPDAFAVLTPVPDGAGGIADLRITHANSAAAKFYRRPAAGIIGRRLSRLMPDAADTGLFACCSEALRTGRPATTRVTSAGPDGALRTFEIHAAAFGEEIVVTAKDVSDLVSAQRELAALQADRDRPGRPGGHGTD